MLTCPNCGRESPEDFAFCPRCAAPLAPAPPPREVRKTVTVVFCDVTGSTSLGERLDPESLRKVMARYFGEMSAALERHGGTVEKFIGDAVMAVFGIPTLHEDDALRAVRAAAEMREALASLNKELERDWGVTLAVRTGVDTGEVVAGDSSAGQALVTGDAVNVAARLEQAAAPGEVLIGSATHRLVRDAVDAEPREPLALKGKGEPVPAFRLLRVIPGAPAHLRRLDSPMVGRERELRLLHETFERAVSDQACQLFTVLGAPGVGKSRLVEELLAGVGGGATVLRGRCLPYGEGITYFPVLEVVKQAAGLADFDAPEVVETKVCAVLEGEEHQDVVCRRVAQLMGVSDLAAPEETFWAIRRFLEAVSGERALVLVFDDLHWGEPTFLDLVEHIADWSRDAPMLLVCMARPDLLDVRPAWGGGKLNATTISLEPLTEVESDRLIANLLGATEIDEEVRRRIAEAAEGNPLFVEEMLAMLIDDGLLAREDGRWVPTGDLSEVTVPPTIQALLAARLDRLSPEERAAMERASVVGKVFYRGAVKELTPEAARPNADANLMTLIRKELVRPDRSTLPGEDAFRFRHLLVRDTAYGAMPKELRAELHERFAGWVERVAGDRVAEQEEILGYHLEQAYRYRTELGPIDEAARGLASRAAARLSAAGRRAFARGDMAGAANLLARTADLLPVEDPARLAFAPQLGTALADLGEFAGAEAVLNEAIDRSRAAGDRGVEAHAHLTRADLRGRIDPRGWKEGGPAAEAAIPVFEELGDERGLSRAWRFLGWDLWVREKAEAATECWERAVEHARLAGDRREELKNLGWLVAAALWGPTPVDDGLRLCDGYLEEAGGHREGEARGLLMRAGFRALQGEFDEAREHSARALAILEDLGQRVWVAWAAQAPGWVEWLAGDLVAAEAALRRGLEEVERLGIGGIRGLLAAMLAQVLYSQGRHDEAEQYARVGEGDDPEDMASQLIARGARSKVLARRGTFEEAERLARSAVELGERIDFINDRADAWSDLAEVLRLAGKPDEAGDAVRQALEFYGQKGNVPSAARARALLEEISG